MPISVDIDDELRTRIERLAEQRRQPAGWIMREAVVQYVTREEARESFLSEATVSWDAFQNDGRHLTGEEARAWLRRWGGVDGASPPVCHE